MTLMDVTVLGGVAIVVLFVFAYAWTHTRCDFCGAWGLKDVRRCHACGAHR